MDIEATKEEIEELKEVQWTQGTIYNLRKIKALESKVETLELENANQAEVIASFTDKLSIVNEENEQLKKELENHVDRFERLDVLINDLQTQINNKKT